MSDLISKILKMVGKGLLGIVFIGAMICTSVELNEHRPYEAADCFSVAIFSEIVRRW